MITVIDYYEGLDLREVWHSSSAPARF